MIFDIVLSVVIFFLLVERYLSQKTNQQEREKLLKMFMAKDLQEVTANEALERLPNQAPEVPNDMVPMEDVADDEKLFDKHIQVMKAAAKEEIRKEHEV